MAHAIWPSQRISAAVAEGIVRTDRPLEVTIGDVGGHLLVNFGDRTIGVTRQHLELAYAITVHKAQGSAFDVVVMPIVAHSLLDRTMIYTGLTKARHKAIFVGDRQAFRRAVAETPSYGRRRSALA